MTLCIWGRIATFLWHCLLLWRKKWFWHQSQGKDNESLEYVTFICHRGFSRGFQLASVSWEYPCPMHCLIHWIWPLVCLNNICRWIAVTLLRDYTWPLGSQKPLSNLLLCSVQLKYLRSWFILRTCGSGISIADCWNILPHIYVSLWWFCLDHFRKNMYPIHQEYCHL